MSRPVGIDSRKIPRFAEDGPLRSPDLVHSPGFDGIFFRTVLDMSPVLDVGALREIKAHANNLGLYIETRSWSSARTLPDWKTDELECESLVGWDAVLAGNDRAVGGHA
jgi:hypothetical protein